MAAQKGYGMKRSWFLIVLCLPLLLCGCAQKSAEREFFAMDTVMQLRAYGPAAEDALAQAEAEIYRLEGVLSCRDEQAALARLNETGGGTAGEETAALLQTALTLCEQTGGAYDPALGALSEAWGFSTGAYRVPEPDALAEALTGGDWGRGQLDALAQKHTLCPFELALSLAQEADVVVCDVPCSGLGIIRKKPDIRYHAKKEGLESLKALQREILKNAVSYVKPGGILLYSTCTIHKAENEENVRWLSEQYPELEVELQKQIFLPLLFQIFLIFPTYRNCHSRTDQD